MECKAGPRKEAPLQPMLAVVVDQVRGAADQLADERLAGEGGLTTITAACAVCLCADG